MFHYFVHLSRAHFAPALFAVLTAVTLQQDKLLHSCPSTLLRHEERYIAS
jgi:hypothetical protein